MLEVANDRLRYPAHVTGLVLPMAVTLFRITSPVQYISAAAFIAWAYGIELGAAQLAAGSALAVVISLGSVGLPGQVSYMATNLPVAQAMGLPVAPLGLLLAVDTIPDVFATLGNVTADLTATSVVARSAVQVEQPGAPVNVEP
jgi:Na+/H+-dicarboxylate symporter